MNFVFTDLSLHDIRSSIMNQGTIEDIQNNIKIMYYDEYSIQENKYIGMTDESKQDFLCDRQMYAEITPKNVTGNGVPKELQYRIAELWIRFRQIRENREILREEEVMNAFFMLCLALKRRILLRRISYLNKLEEAVIVRDVRELQL